MSDWTPFDGGRTLGQPGSEGGIILLDDEHAGGARITIERSGRSAPFAITCGVYGWLVHTRFFASEADARRDCAEMKTALADLATTLDTCDLKSAGEACSRFTTRFP